MKIILFMCLLIVWYQSARASTFVGNGGSWLDPELNLAVYELAEILEGVAGLYSLESCDFRECEVLDSLAEDQYRFAAKFFIARRDKVIRKLLGKSTKFLWTNDEILIKSYGGRRKFSAVARDNKIILSESVFSRLSRLQRMSLLLHEINHLIPFQGRVLHDQDAIGPFSGEEGVRRLLDLQGVLLLAAIDTISYHSEEQSNLSSPVSNVFIQMRGLRQSVSASEAKRLLQSRYVVQENSADYFPAMNHEIGLHLAKRTIESKNNQLIQSSISSQSYHLGVSLRGRLVSLFRQDIGVDRHFSSNYWDRVFWQSRISLGFHKFSHTLADQFSSISGSHEFYSLGGELDIYLPLYYGFWFQYGVGLQWQDYEIKDTNFRSKSVYKEINWGISYAFSI